jgi:hypothetical protein
MRRIRKTACRKDNPKAIFNQSSESIWEATRKSDSNSSSPGNRGSFTDMDQSVDNIIRGIEKGANRAKTPDHSKNDDA